MLLLSSTLRITHKILSITLKKVRYDVAVIRGDRLFVALSKNDFWDDIYDPGDNIVIVDGEYWKYSDEELAQATA